MAIPQGDVTGLWQYDLYELERGQAVWCTQIMGTMYAGYKLGELYGRTSKECYLARCPRQEVVARLNAGPAKDRSQAVFHVAYDLTLADKLARELACRGYRSGYAAGNDLAFAVLSTRIECDVFILGFEAPHQIRSEIAAWINSEHPGIPIIALKSPGEPEIPIQFNLQIDKGCPLLPSIARALDALRRRNWNASGGECASSLRPIVGCKAIRY